MSTINVSLPENLKKQAENLVDSGYYSSFSDVVRTALRGLVANSEYDLLARGGQRRTKEWKGSCS